MSKGDALHWQDAELLNALGAGADLETPPAADRAKALQGRGLVSLGPAKGRALYGAKPTAKGRKAAAEYFARELGVRRWES